MNFYKPERELKPESSKVERLLFTDKFKDLLPGVAFKEPTEMLEARTAVLAALAGENQNPDFIRSVWIEYAKVCEQIVDSETDIKLRDRALLQIVMLLHKALIFREAGNTLRYGESLNDAKEYAYNILLDEIAAAIDAELDKLTS